MRIAPRIPHRSPSSIRPRIRSTLICGIHVLAKPLALPISLLATNLGLPIIVPAANTACPLAKVEELRYLLSRSLRPLDHFKLRLQRAPPCGVALRGIGLLWGLSGESCSRDLAEAKGVGIAGVGVRATEVLVGCRVTPDWSLSPRFSAAGMEALSAPLYI